VINPPETLETARLRLRKPVLEDADEIFRQYAQDVEVTKYVSWRAHRSVNETREFIRLCLEELAAKKSVHLVIVRKEDHQLLGMIGLRGGDHKWELGYVLARAYWRKGYMTEAVKALVTWALQRPEIYRVWAVCDIDNKASARVMEKAGMQREGILRRWSIHPNVSDEPRDSHCYAIIKQSQARSLDAAVRRPRQRKVRV
jgi:[ribosomal protein S5]-alanine N-acetyltransferase